MRLAWELSVRGVDDAQEVLARQNRRIQNPDRSREFAFVAQAFAADPDRFFESLKKKENRKHEPWVLQALAYLHHPLRQKNAIKYIKPSLICLKKSRQLGTSSSLKDGSTPPSPAITPRRRPRSFAIF